MLWALYGRVGEMVSDKVVQNAVQTLKAELVQIRKVLERIAVAHTVPTVINAVRVTKETLKIPILLIIYPFKRKTPPGPCSAREGVRHCIAPSIVAWGGPGGYGHPRLCRSAFPLLPIDETGIPLIN